MKSLALVSSHKCMSTEVYKTLRDHTPGLQKLDWSPTLADTGEPLFYSSDQPPVYCTAPKDLAAARKILEPWAQDHLIRITGYPAVLPGLKDKFTFLYLRRAVEDQAYSIIHQNRWMHVLRACPDTKDAYKSWKDRYVNMTGSYEMYVALAPEVCRALLYVEAQHVAVADVEIWHHQVYQEPQVLQARLQEHGYEFEIPADQHLRDRSLSIDARLAMRQTDEWLAIQELCRKIRSE